MDKWISFGVSL